MNGILVVDKPSGPTSHDVVARARRLLGQRGVGHLGTLDPTATGVLPLVLGNLTRLAQFYLASEKSYEGLIRFGLATDTYDAEGQPTAAEQEFTFSLEQVRDLAAAFRGRIQQLPPPFSAKKIQGVRAYKLAREKKKVPLKPLSVEIREFEILGLQDGCAQFRARVSSGTYMRSIAHDLGQAAGCGAHLKSLCRTAVAEFSLDDAHSFEVIERVCQDAQEDAQNLLVHPRKLLPAFPAVSVGDDVSGRIRHGQSVNLSEFSDARRVKVFSGQRELIAIATRVAGTLFHPEIVLM